MSKIARVLTGCTSPETAFVQADYPFGFQLRCVRRCWLEYKKNKGFRFVTQTTDPRRPGVWNKPKTSTYTEIAVLVLTDEHTNDAGEPTHVTWVCGSLSSSADSIESLMAAFWDQMDETQRAVALAFHKASLAYGSKPTGYAFRVTDNATGEPLTDEPVTAAWKGFAGAMVVDGVLKYTPPLNYVNERNPATVLDLPMLGRVARVDLVMEQKAAA